MNRIPGVSGACPTAAPRLFTLSVEDAQFAAAESTTAVFTREVFTAVGSGNGTPTIEVGEPEEGYIVVHVAGDLDAVSAPALRARLGDGLIHRHTAVLDLRDVPFVGCTAMSVIDAAAAVLTARGGRLVVLCGRQTRRHLAICGVGRRATVVAV
ncbi:exported hypothetical protein [Rhodococcus sp. RD6.2]|jgi:anti-sigma B factor antagonist|uniref:STAS domain-containing protein n=1 Tax=Rhodococcus sp. RD6.2 TaxID=260936 RepID=UPI00063BC405|nr:STAS domain-containing protein [Rhodococcus sp. RD6.2]CRK51137.1 exported hypothetical protein [Rhodococcus sp. RD6.2]